MAVVYANKHTYKHTDPNPPRVACFACKDFKCSKYERRYNVPCLLKAIAIEAKAMAKQNNPYGVIFVCGALLEMVPDLVERCNA